MSSVVRPVEQFLTTLKAARRVSTPLVAIRTADPALALARIEDAVGGTAVERIKLRDPLDKYHSAIDNYTAP